MKLRIVNRSTWVHDQPYSAWVKNDVRSVSAMLSGRGDGRENLYEEFVKIKRMENLGISLEQVDADYAEYIRHWEESQRARQQHGRTVFVYVKKLILSKLLWIEF